MELKKLKLTIHPLFFISGIYFAFLGKVYSFLIFTLTALIHEFGHFCKAEKLGYMLKKVQLMPYGAVIRGDLFGLKYRDEILIALFGPFVNFCVGVVCVALWWCFPSCYPFTEEIVFANFSLCVINLLPFFPLDGGRILLATLSLKIKREKSIKICKVISAMACLLLVGLYVYSFVIGAKNVTILFFAFFIFAGCFMAKKENSYVRIFSAFSLKKIKRGMEVKKVALSYKSHVRDLLAIVSAEYIYELAIYDNSGKLVMQFSPEQVIEMLSTKSPYDKIM